MNAVSGCNHCSRFLYFLMACALVTGVGCQFSSSQTQTETQVGRNKIIMSPGCRSQSSHRDTRQRADGSEELLSAQFQCDGTSVLIQGNTLLVNGAAYGTVKDGDTIQIRNGQVRVDSETRSIINKK